MCFSTSLQQLKPFCITEEVLFLCGCRKRMERITLHDIADWLEANEELFEATNESREVLGLQPLSNKQDVRPTLLIA